MWPPIPWILAPICLHSRPTSRTTPTRKHLPLPYYERTNMRHLTFGWPFPFSITRFTQSSRYDNSRNPSTIRAGVAEVGWRKSVRGMYKVPLRIIRRQQPLLIGFLQSKAIPLVTRKLVWRTYLLTIWTLDTPFVLTNQRVSYYIPPSPLVTVTMGKQVLCLAYFQLYKSRSTSW